MTLPKSAISVKDEEFKIISILLLFFGLQNFFVFLCRYVFLDLLVFCYIIVRVLWSGFVLRT